MSVVRFDVFPLLSTDVRLRLSINPMAAILVLSRAEASCVIHTTKNEQKAQRNKTRSEQRQNKHKKQKVADLHVGSDRGYENMSALPAGYACAFISTYGGGSGAKTRDEKIIARLFRVSRARNVIITCMKRTHAAPTRAAH